MNTDAGSSPDPLPSGPGRPGTPAIHPEGKIIAGRYRIVRPIGAGGQAVVYRAQDSRPPRPVALKFLVVHEGVAAEEFRRFSREAQVIAALNHPNIIQVIEIGEWESKPFIAMEFADGGTLRHLVEERGKLPLPAACEFMRQIGRALGHAHRKNVIHRDLKPGNVLLTREAVPKLADFGLAKVVTDLELSRSGYGMGTLGFVSQEQRHDSKNVDHRTDIYSWGATFFQLVTGRDPLSWDPEVIPAPVRGVIKKCLKEVDERYASMDEALAAMDAALASSPAAAPSGACPRCRAENPAGAKRCSACDESLVRPCPVCQTENPWNVAVCGACGQEIDRIHRFDELVARARTLSKEGALAQAIKELETAVSLFPANVEAKELLEETRRNQSTVERLKPRLRDPDLDVRAEAAKQILALTPLNEGVRKLAAEWLPGKERLDHAVETARAALLANRFEEAVRAVDEILKDGSYPAAEKIRAKALEKIQARARALSEADEALKKRRFAAAVRHLHAAQSIRPEPEVERKLHFAQARLRKRLGAWIGAASGAAALLVLVLWIRHSHAAREEAARAALAALADKAANYERTHEWNKALLAWEDYIRAGGDREKREECDKKMEGSFQESMKQAEAYLAVRDKVKAEMACDGALAVKPGDPRGVEFKKRMGDAEKQWRYDDLVARAREEVKIGAWLQAQGTCNQILAIRPGDPAATDMLRQAEDGDREWRYRQAISRAETYISSKQWRTADEACDEALKLRPDDVKAKDLKARISTNLIEVRYTEAMGEGQTRFQMKEWGLALEAYHQALAAKPDDATARESLKKTQEKASTDPMLFKPVRTLTGPGGIVTSVAFRLDGRILAAAGQDGKITLWDPETGNELRTLQGFRVAFSPNGKNLVAVLPKKIAVYDANGEKEIRSLAAEGIVSLAFSADSAIFAAGTESGKVKLWDFAKGEELRTLAAHKSAVGALAFSPDGKYLVTAGEDSKLRLYEVAGKGIWTFSEQPNPVRSLAYDRRGVDLAAGCYDGRILLWLAFNGELRASQPLKGHDGEASAILFTEEGRIVSAGKDKQIRVWRHGTGRPQEASLSDHKAAVTSLSLRGDGKMLASGSADTTVRLWEFKD